MKLKFELVNGYGILVDQEAEIKEGDFIIKNGFIFQAVENFAFSNNGKITISYLKQSPKPKIIFAEPELKLEDVPVFEWRDFEPNEKSLLSMFYNTCKATYPLFDDWIEAKEYKKWLEKSNPAKYTEEDIERAFIVGLNCSQEISLKGLPTDEGLDYQYKKLNQLIQSLQKYPEYVVMESDTMNKGYIDKTEIPYQECEVLKLFTNSEKKQQGTVKEIIWK